MRRRLTTQLGQRLIRKCQRWVKLSEVEVRLQRDMEDWGTNYDSTLYLLSNTGWESRVGAVTCLLKPSPLYSIL